MLDQSFSSANFNLLFLKENRKGNFNKSHFTDEYIDKHLEFNTIVHEKASLKKETKVLSKETLNLFAKRLEKINNEKEEIRLSIFEELSRTINEKNFQFKIEYNPSKEVYSINNNATSYYAIKQLQSNIHKTFKVVQADRNLIVKQLFNSVSDGFPKVIIKTDIKAFYESIPQDKLFEKIDENTLLSPFSKKLIRKLFYEFESKKDTLKIQPQKGVPRGIGLSAYLSELYMRGIDSDIKSIKDIIYYARYVDDIVIIFSPKTESTKRDYLKEVKNIICDKNNLSIKDGSDGKENKTFTIDLTIKGDYSEKFTFLGYSFNIRRKKIEDRLDFSVDLEISDNKIKRYKDRLNSSIEAYNKDSFFNERKARNMLFARLKFLTGNYHLNNNKRNVKAGVYYSNRMLCLNKKTKSLENLDIILMEEVRSIAPPPKIGIKKGNLIRHIKNNFSFRKGFFEKERHFYSFLFNKSDKEFYSKKFGRPTNKFEVIKSIWK